ncbi:MFS general substrate transporter [Paxillus ammoniavirescens]|nr:MFS general substrate transporter [Paxillus ammoniavirescens]
MTTSLSLERQESMFSTHCNRASADPDTSSDDQALLLSSDGISVLLLSGLVEAVATQYIYPFINQLIRELDVTGGDETKVGYYAGMIVSLFYATQAMTTLQWSRASDRVGRKPVLLLGIFGLSLSMLCFGLSRTFTTLVLSHCITGALNGSAGVMKSMLGELTDSTNRARGFAWFPLACSLGTVLGPAFGGTLSRPQDNFPHLFTSPFWAEFPYFLPCSVAAGFSMLSFVAILLFLEETLPRGLTQIKATSLVERETEHLEAGYGTVDRQQRLSVHAPVPLRQLLNASRVLYIANYGVLATFDIVLWALLPLFYSTPIEFGGLGFTPMSIGLYISGFGATNGLIQAFCFAPLTNRLGPKTLLRISHACFIPIFGIIAIVSWVAKLWGISWVVWALLASQLILTVIMDMSFTCILMYITAAAPNQRSLGALNGLAQTTVSIVRVIGPASSMSLFAYSIQHNFMGGYGAYFVIILLVIATAPLCAMLPDNVANTN